MRQFLYEVGHDTGKITYGEEQVRRALESGAVNTLLLSEGLEMTRVTVKCGACNYQEQHTVKNKALQEFEQSLTGKPCSKCGAASLGIIEKEDVIDDFVKLAEYTNTQVEIISTETEEGQMLKNSFGGVAALLRFNVHEQ